MRTSRVWSSGRMARASLRFTSTPTGMITASPTAVRLAHSDLVNDCRQQTVTSVLPAYIYEMTGRTVFLRLDVGDSLALRCTRDCRHMHFVNFCVKLDRPDYPGPSS